MYVTRSYNRFEFDHISSTITKFSKENRLCNESRYYKNIPSNLAAYFPRVYDSGFNSETKEYFLSMEQYGYHNLGDYLINLDQHCDFSEIAQHLSDILDEFQRNPASTNDDFIGDQKYMYEIKTETEYQRLIDNFETFQKIREHEIVYINGIGYLNFEKIWPRIKPYFKSILYDNSKPTFIHGDFCFSNILCGFSENNKSILRFVDPRGQFGCYLTDGDIYYDLAKLMHSTDGGYEYFINDQFNLHHDLYLQYFTLEYIGQSRKNIVNSIFNSVLYSKYNTQKIKLIEGAIFISMIARHGDSTSRQISMYLTGIKILNEVFLEIYPHILNNTYGKNI